MPRRSASGAVLVGARSPCHVKAHTRNGGAGSRRERREQRASTHCSCVRAHTAGCVCVRTQLERAKTIGARGPDHAVVHAVGISRGTRAVETARGRRVAEGRVAAPTGPRSDGVGGHAVARAARSEVVGRHARRSGRARARWRRRRRRHHFGGRRLRGRGPPQRVAAGGGVPRRASGAPRCAVTVRGACGLGGVPMGPSGCRAPHTRA